MSGWEAARFGWLLACMVAASVTDVRERRIPNAVVVACALATPLWVAGEVLSWQHALLGGGLLGGVFLLPALLGKAGMGDAKLAAALGMGLGWEQVGPLLVGMAVSVPLAVGVARLVGWRMRRTRVTAAWPLAPFFVVGVLATALGVR